MDQAHPLTLNLHKVANCLKDVLLPEEIEKIKAELRRNVRQTLRLSENHLRSAQRAKESGTGSWRHVVSRSYYCCYCASRAVRLAKTGAFFVDVDDHKRIGDLPVAFPSHAVWSDRLTKFRGDRNLADYDHSIRENSLEYSSIKYLTLAEEFLGKVKQYLRGEGLI